MRGPDETHRSTDAVERIRRLLDEAVSRHPARARPRPHRPASSAVSRSPRFGPSETFTVRPSTAGGFRAVEAALARKLVSLSHAPERLAVIVALDAGPEVNLFTQTLVDREGGAWVEAAGNECIYPADRRLDDDQLLLLEAFGFSPPTDRTPNHFVVFPQPTEWARVAGLVVQPLEAVYGLPADAQLELRIFPVGPAEAFRRLDDDDVGDTD